MGSITDVLGNIFSFFTTFADAGSDAAQGFVDAGSDAIGGFEGIIAGSLGIEG